ncbi:sensor histidine kinase [Calidithermus chliarophilus]|uniref:sensor histidine kinase n=1 Tax=Calidithermus chliarophilus TaxID=52023 RepID=UPI00042729DE|nr:ATP-binding protein [Calidithermus chliarophilus]
MHWRRRHWRGETEPPWVWQRREHWRGRWGLRRRLTFFFTFVALTAVFLTTWFTLGAVYSALFGDAPQASGHEGRWWNWRQGAWSDPQFAQARELFGRITGTAFWSGTLAFLLASVAAAVVTRILTRPLVALTDGAKRLEAGERGLRLRVPRANDELQALTVAFNNLATGLERQEAWRRNLVADIAHDLRTPLAVLRSEIEAMQDGVVPLGGEGLGRLHAQVMLLSKLVDDLRTLSLAESGGLGLRLETLELEPFLRGVAEAFAPRAAQAGMEVRLQLLPSRLSARFDPAQITRVLGNLLENAMRYAAGPIELSAIPHEGGVKVQVRDHGPGLSPEALERVFERFYRADPSRTRAEGSGGSGLGLTIARAIVEAHGGRLEASNHPEGGAVFTLTLRSDPPAGAGR